MTIDIFEELLRKPSLFKDESKLESNFIPKKLPHRLKELSLLSQLFLSLITKKNSISRKILVTGATGIGKTATIKFFGKLIRQAAKKREISIHYIHINCRKERTSYKVLIKIIRFFISDFPKRGYSPQDLLDALIEVLNAQDTHLIIVLDELSYLVKNDEDIIYSLTRLNEDTFNRPQRISIIGIVRDLSCLMNLDPSTLSTLQRNIISFKKYNKDQTFDILKYRSKISLEDNIISDSLIRMITEIIYKNGDIRYGLNLLWKAGQIAEGKGLTRITEECIRLGTEESVPYLTKDLLIEMNDQKLIFLLAIIQGLELNPGTGVLFSEVSSRYLILCENTGFKVLSNSQLWNYLQEFKRESIISIKVQSKEIKGRKSHIEILEIPLDKLKATIIQLLSSNGIRI